MGTIKEILNLIIYYLIVVLSVASLGGEKSPKKVQFDNTLLLRAFAGE